MVLYLGHPIRHMRLIFAGIDWKNILLVFITIMFNSTPLMRLPDPASLFLFELVGQEEHPITENSYQHSHGGMDRQLLDGD